MARILVVDDEIGIRGAIQRALQRAGHEIMPAVDGLADATSMGATGSLTKPFTLGELRDVVTRALAAGRRADTG
jgi:DNA-binding NtrC family response regulator